MKKEEAFKILRKYVTQEHLIKHALSVEAVVKHFANLYGEEEEYWGTIGLLHDIDYEKYPEEHCIKCEEILKQEGFCEEQIKSIKSHGYGICTNIKPEHKMEKVLYTIDELTGLITASALMQPNKKLEELSLKSLKKKFKNKGFAAKVDRDIILNGAQMLGEDIEYVMEQSLIAMQKVSQELGL